MFDSHHRRVGFSVDQRRRGAHAVRRAESAPSRGQNSRHGAAHAGHQTRRIRRDSLPQGRPFHCARLSAGGSLRSHRRGRLLCRRVHRVSRRTRNRSRGSNRSRRAAARGDLWFGDGQLLLREIRRGSIPNAHPRRNRRPLPGV